VRKKKTLVLFQKVAHEKGQRRKDDGPGYARAERNFPQAKKKRRRRPEGEKPGLVEEKAVN